MAIQMRPPFDSNRRYEEDLRIAIEYIDRLAAADPRNRIYTSEELSKIREGLLKRQMKIRNWGPDDEPEPPDFDYVSQGFDSATRKVRSIDPSVKETQSKEAEERAKVIAHEKRVEELDAALTRRVLELKSARRTVATYRKVHHLYTMTIALSLMVATFGFVMIILGLGAGWVPIGVGLVSTLVNSIGKSSWHEKHKIKREHMNPGTSNAYWASMEYIDPQLNVDMAEVQYAKALRQLTEATGGDDSG